MQLIPVELEASGVDARCGERCFRALSAVIDDIGSDDFGSSALAALNRWVPLSWWSVYRLFDDQPPTMYTSGSFGVADGTRESFRRYRQTLYQHDQTFFAARECTRDAPHVVMHWHAMEIPRRHREEIYLRHGLRERLSIVSNDRGQGLLAVNFYRHEHLEPFADDEIDAFRTACVPLLSCVRRHLSLSSEGERRRWLPASPAANATSASGS